MVRCHASAVPAVVRRSILCGDRHVGQVVDSCLLILGPKCPQGTSCAKDVVASSLSRFLIRLKVVHPREATSMGEALYAFIRLAGHWARSRCVGTSACRLGHQPSKGVPVDTSGHGKSFCSAAPRSRLQEGSSSGQLPKQLRYHVKERASLSFLDIH